MSIETELKLRITPEALARLKRHALLRKYAVTRPVTRRLYNIYFDTPKLALHKSRKALRLRRAGRQWIQTLKGGGSVRAGLHQRNEWEVPVSRPELDFSMSLEMGGAGVVDWDVLLPQPVRKKLHPVFVTDFSRSVRLLDYQGAEIELCMDRGEVSTEQHSMPLCELELELKSGEPRQIFELALEILDVVPVELELVNKAEYGYRLLSGYTDAPVKAAVPEVKGSEAITEVLQSLVWSCLQHLQTNLRGAMACDDAEYLHQMRVALRRLRVVLRMVEKLRKDKQLSTLINEAAALCKALGKIRELDVFISQTLQPMCKRIPNHVGLEALLAVAGQRRAAYYAAMRGAGRAREMQCLILNFSIWMCGPYWLHAKETPQLRVFATHQLCKLASRFSRDSKQLKSPDMHKLHALRILVKRLRYSAELFFCLYDKRASKAFLAKLSEIQEVLGRINDISVANRLLDELSDEAFLAVNSLPESCEGIALVRGWIAHDLLHEFAALHNAVSCFNKQPVFWDK